MQPEIMLGQKLRRGGKTLAVAESCTGGLVSNRITDVSGSSKYFLAGIVCYSNKAKQDILGVSESSIKKYGAVSKQVALEMAEGVKLLSGADMGAGLTGIAGPTGGTKQKKVGLVYIAFVTNGKRIVKKFNFKGSRKRIKLQASEAALILVLKEVR
jgi:PncC family amidohydrolase